MLTPSARSQRMSPHPSSAVEPLPTPDRAMQLVADMDNRIVDVQKAAAAGLAPRVDAEDASDVVSSPEPPD
jgi:hypothetical protein